MAFVSKLKKPKVYIPLLLVVLIGGWFLFRGDENPTSGIETREVASMTVAQVVDETGVVESADEAALAFETSGRVNEIAVTEGTHVEVGEVLARLENSDAQADLLSAEAALAAARADLAELRRNVADGDAASDRALIVEQQEAAIEDAYEALLNNDLQAYPQDDPSQESAAAPTISGVYTCSEEGEYVIETYSSGAPSGASFRFSGLESGLRSASTVHPEPLGSCGLSVTFPDLPGYQLVNREWVIPIPNTRSTTYLTARNAYQAAQKSASVTVEQTTVSTQQIAAQEARVLQAEAALARAQANLDKTVLRAPFSGTVTDVTITVGEFASASATTFSLISDEQFEVTVPIPEADIANVDVGDEATVTFDAYDDEFFAAEVAFITPSAREIEGVPAFEATLVFQEDDPRIRAGLSADVEINAEARENVLAIPARAVVRQNGRTFVRTLSDGVVAEVDVTVGLRGSDGFVEVTSGLSEGDMVITFIDEATLEQFENSDDGTTHSVQEGVQIHLQ